MPRQSRMFERNPFHEVYKGNRDMQSRIIIAKLRQELLTGRKPKLQEQIYMESAAVLILELKAMQTKYLKAKKTKPAKEFYSVLNTLRNTLNQIQPKGRPGKSSKTGEASLDLGAIING